MDLGNSWLSKKSKLITTCALFIAAGVSYYASPLIFPADATSANTYLTAYLEE